MMGDFNTDLKKDSEFTNLLKQGSMILPLQFMDTVKKERSSMQYQVNKINKVDISAKDAILSSACMVDYKSFYTKWSDHHIV